MSTPARKPRKPETPSAHLDMAKMYLHLAARHIDTAGDLAGTSKAAQVVDLLKTWDNYKGNWALSTQAHKTWRLP
jgi:hypothetical protein